MDSLTVVVGLLLGGLLLGFLAGWLVVRSQREAVLQGKKAAEERILALAQQVEALQRERDDLREENRRDLVEKTRLGEQAQILEQQQSEARAERQRLQQDLSALQEKNSRLQSQLAEKDTLLEQQRHWGEEQMRLLKDSEGRLTEQLKNLSNEILEEKSKKFTEANRTSLDAILGPLREQLRDFRKKVEDVYDKESRDRVELRTQINALKSLNEKISQDALNLTNALKGQAKTQGTWGELILQRVLEMSGLVAGREYETEAHHDVGDGRAQRPDVIVHLPDRKDVIIDAKVSLVGYERYCSARDDAARDAALAEHLRSVRNHVNQLSARGYEKIDAIESLDYVLMFVPVEPALLTALEKDPTLFEQALRKNVMLVGPSTLLGTLRIIENIWRYEHQSRNAQEIAAKAGDLYDKFVGFVTDFQKIGKQLESTRSSYEEAHKKLSGGRGNLVKRSEDLRKLGVKPTKSLPETLVNQAESEALPTPEND